MSERMTCGNSSNRGRRRLLAQAAHLRPSAACGVAILPSDYHSNHHTTHKSPCSQAAHLCPSAASGVTILPSDALVANQPTVMPLLPVSRRSPLSAQEATKQALAAPNRGPLVLDATGRVPQQITDAFEEFGFYVFEGLLRTDELKELQADMHAVIQAATHAHGAGLEGFNHNGIQIKTSSFGFAVPLSDNSSPTGRSPSPMKEYSPPTGSPDRVCRGASYYMRFSEPGVRLYGHPLLLAVAEAVNGVGFTPFSDSLQVKIARLGPAVAWHQDGTTHWEIFGDRAEHGFNFMCQLHGSTAENAVWVLPGSHRWGHLDIPQIIAQHGERVPGALPMITSPGDVVICNRNALHCSYPNTSDRTRITLNFGFHKRSAVDAAGDALRLPGAETGKLRAMEINRRCRAIPLAIAARKHHYPDEATYDYMGLTEEWHGFGPEQQNLFANCYIGL